MTLHDDSAAPDIHMVREKIRADILARPGVNGLDIGKRRIGGTETDELAIRVYVEKKDPGIPNYQRIPTVIDGFRTDVIEAPRNPNWAKLPALPATAPGKAADPEPAFTLRSGLSTSQFPYFPPPPFTKFDPSKSNAWGTVGLVLRDESKKAFFLTASHVLYNNAAAKKDDLISVPQAWAGGDVHVVGYLDENYFGDFGHPIYVDGKLLRYAAMGVDCCKVRLLDNVPIDTKIPGIGRVRGVGAALRGMLVRYRGAATGAVVIGQIDSLDTDEAITDPHTGDELTLDELFTIRLTPGQKVQAGDSGAAIINPDGQVIGILIGTLRADNELAFACHIHSALETTDSKMIVEADPAEPELTQLYRYHNRRLNQYLLSTNDFEGELMDADWEYQTYYKVPSYQAAGTVPVFRYRSVHYHDYWLRNDWYAMRTFPPRALYELEPEVFYLYKDPAPDRIAIYTWSMWWEGNRLLHFYTIHADKSGDAAGWHTRDGLLGYAVKS
jgi:hypothetical protein